MAVTFAFAKSRITTCSCIAIDALFSWTANLLRGLQSSAYCSLSVLVHKTEKLMTTLTIAVGYESPGHASLPSLPQMHVKREDI